MPTREAIDTEGSALAPPAGRPAAEPGLARLAGHLPALDGLRGIAILLVLALHFRGYDLQPETAGDIALYRLLSAGWIGVDLFFVLSGFLITGILLDAKGAPHYFKNFYLRRALRIFPLYYAFLALHFFLLPLLEPTGSAELAALEDAEPWYWTYLANVHRAMNTEGRGPYGLGHLWSLAIEEQFYLVWPLVVRLVSWRTLRWIAVGGMAVSFLLRAGLNLIDAHPMVAYVLTPTHMGALLAGAFLAVTVRRPKGMRLVERTWLPVAAIAFVFLLFTLDRTGFRLTWEPVYANVKLFTVLAVFFTAVVGGALTAAPGGRARRVLSSPPLTALGRYSYAIYLVHTPIIYWWDRAGFTAASFPAVAGSFAPGRIAFIALGSAASFLVALASWHLLEKRFLALKDRFPYGRAPRRPPSTMPVP